MAQRATGLFVTHVDAPRVRRHFERLVAESGELVEWTYLHNSGRGVNPALALPHDPAVLMPPRYDDFVGCGELAGGYNDVLFLPYVLAMASRYVWVIEYDVDFSGSWRSLFEQFEDSAADLITSWIRTPAEAEGWPHWETARAPGWVDRGAWLKGFHPLVRLSRQFAQRYADMMCDRSWGGHMEFTLATAATATGALIEDVGQEGGTFLPPGRRVNYTGLTEQARGTYVWRPARPAYFHEDPDAFELPNLIYHPIKPEVAPWEELVQQASLT